MFMHHVPGGNPMIQMPIALWNGVRREAGTKCLIGMGMFMGLKCIIYDTTYGARPLARSIETYSIICEQWGAAKLAALFLFVPAICINSRVNAGLAGVAAIGASKVAGKCGREDLVQKIDSAKDKLFAFATRSPKTELQAIGAITTIGTIGVVSSFIFKMLSQIKYQNPVSPIPFLIEFPGSYYIDLGFETCLPYINKDFPRSVSWFDRF